MNIFTDKSLLTHHSRMVYFWMMVFFILSISGYADLANEIETLTGGRTKIVWARSVTGKGERDVSTANYDLIGFDTEKGAEHRIITGPASCANPWITPDGTRVIFTDWVHNKVMIVNWNGTHKRSLLSGFALTVFKDQDSGIEWVYVSEKPYGDIITRYQIDNPENHELIWNRTKTSIRFTLSADGTRAGGEFPWNKAGISILPNISFTKLGSGCNATIAPDNSYHFFHQVSQHKDIHFYKNGEGESTIINLQSAPGLGDHPVWIPKWSNKPAIFTMTGPESDMTNLCNIYLGRFNPDFTAVENWVRVTSYRDTFDIYAYAWISHDPHLQFEPQELNFKINENDTQMVEKEVVATITSGPSTKLSAKTQAEWLQLSVNGDGLNQTIVHSLDPRNMSSGEYKTAVMVSGTNINPELYTVTAVIDGLPYLKSIRVLPGEIQIPRTKTAQFSAQSLDQFNQVYPCAIQWSVSQGGTIDPTGLFKSNGDEGRFVIIATAKNNQNIKGLATIEVYKDILIIAPQKDDTYKTKRTLGILWQADTSVVNAVSLDFSVNSGKTWFSLNPNSSVGVADSNWGHYNWIIPDSITDPSSGITQSTISNTCKVKVTSYTNISISSQSGNFTITDSITSIKCNMSGLQAVKDWQLVTNDAQIMIKLLDGSNSGRVQIFSPNGRKIYTSKITNQKYLVLPLTSFSTGIYIIQLQTKKRIYNGIFSILK